MLFKKNDVEITTHEEIKGKKFLEKELKEISQLQPNNKLLGMTKTRLWFYNVSFKGRQSKFRQWMRNKIGEPPVLYDSLTALKSTLLMENYLANNGYFFSKITFSKKFEKKRATVTYHVDLGKRYHLDQVAFVNDSARYQWVIQDNSMASYLKKDDPFEVRELKSERSRIADDMRNNGYYFFNKEYVSFDLDSAQQDYTIDIDVKIDTNDVEEGFKVFQINNVYIQTDFSIEQLSKQIEFDTLLVDSLWGIYLINEGPLKYKPFVLTNAVFVKRGNLYNQISQKKTISALADLGFFKFINVQYAKSSRTDGNYLDCIIRLTPGKKQSLGVEAEASNASDYDFGIAANVFYQNRNIFKGLELLEMSVQAGIESSFGTGSFFNTIDIKADLSLTFNKFLVPFRIKASKNSRVKTRISLRNSFISRIDLYTVNSTNLSLTYDWQETITKRHQFSPIVIDLIRVQESSEEFFDLIERSQSLRNSFTEQLIIGMQYDYIWTTKLLDRVDRHDYWFKLGLDLAGNFVHGINGLARINKDDELPYEIFNIPYAQYFRADADFRYYKDVARKAQFATRVFGGFGVPYGNSDALPYIKQFFAGGANGIRAWRIRTLGPGSYNVEDSGVDEESFTFDQTGDIKLEASAELRFDMVSFIKGAVFVDVGNVWALKADTSRVGANFDITRFHKEIAIGTGFGLRIDFSYFILRFDIATPLRDPSEERPWVIKDFQFSDLRFNLAIGYPF